MPLRGSGSARRRAASAETADIMADIDAFTDIAPDRITDVFSRVE